MAELLTASCPHLCRFAGAGLFDSVPTERPEAVRVDYSQDKLVNDAAYRHAQLSSIALAALLIEQAMGGPQDIEGVLTADGEVVVVQTRPQQ